MGKLLDKVTKMPIKINFEAVTIGENLVNLEEDILKDLSDDQKYGYSIVQAIRTGIIPDNLANLEIGPLNHSRWLTTANRFLRLYCSEHGHKGSILRNLRLITEYIVGVYYPMWFRIKVMHSLMDQDMFYTRSSW